VYVSFAIFYSRYLSLRDFHVSTVAVNNVNRICLCNRGNWKFWISLLSSVHMCEHVSASCFVRALNFKLHLAHVNPITRNPIVARFFFIILFLNLTLSLIYIYDKYLLMQHVRI